MNLFRIIKIFKINLNKNSQRLAISILGFVSLIALLVIQVNWLRESIKTQEAIFSRGVYMAMQKSIEKDTLLGTEDVFSDEVISRMESAMKKELKLYHINLGFHLILINGEDTLSRAPISKIKEKELFRHSINSPDTQAEVELAIHFPDRNTFILKKTAIMFITSVFLIMFTIIAIFTIFAYYIKERKFAEQIKDMVINVTHEFMTPVSSISLASNMLINRSSKTEDASALNLATTIKEENKKLQKQTLRLLRLAEVESGNFDYDKKSVNIHLLLEETLESLRFQIENKSGVVECDFGAHKFEVYADESRIGDVFSNLLLNSIKYCVEPLRIKVKTENKGNRVNINFSDNGIGIHPKEQKRIFDKYYRVTKGNTHNTKGFGIGLYFAKIVIEGHGGSIKVISEPLKGSTFIVSLPVLS